MPYLDGPCRFVLMLTRQDRTVSNARAVLEEALAAGVRHIGFKDVGLPPPELIGLVEAIRNAGGTVYLEVAWRLPGRLSSDVG